jgi:hypothetical protein
MNKLNFNISIDAPGEKVWEALWGLQNYPQWTAPFAEGSNVKTDGWKKGSKVLFVGPDGSGMVAYVEDNIPNEYMSFKHVGMIDKDGVEDMESPKVKEWAGAHENYTLKSSNGKTDLIVDMDINGDYIDYFQEAWPKALDKVKELAEGSK